MLHIETSGSWYEMGQKVGRTFANELRTCMRHYTPWLFENPAPYTHQIDAIARQVQELAPDLHEETLGMAVGADIPIHQMTGYRAFNAVRLWPDPGCSVIFLADSDVGPILGRNCDLFPGFDPPMQLCQVYRPNDGPALATCTYLGTPGVCGINALGVAAGSASAHTDERYGTSGWTNGLLASRIIRQGRSVDAVLQSFANVHFLGKPCNDMIADAAGDSAVMELAPGRQPVILPRKAGKDWQMCTNFFASGLIPMSRETDYLQSAFARFGRVCHVLDDLQTPRTLDGLKNLLTEIAQPGLVDTGRDGVVKTAFAQIMELRTATMHYTPGHPAEQPWKTIRL